MLIELIVTTVPILCLIMLCLIITRLEDIMQKITDCYHMGKLIMINSDTNKTAYSDIMKLLKDLNIIKTLKSQSMKLQESTEDLLSKVESTEKTILKDMDGIWKKIHDLEKSINHEDSMEMLKSIQDNTIKRADDVRLTDYAILQTIKELNEALNNISDNIESSRQEILDKSSTNNIDGLAKKIEKKIDNREKAFNKDTDDTVRALLVMNHGIRYDVERIWMKIDSLTFNDEFYKGEITYEESERLRNLKAEDRIFMTPYNKNKVFGKDN